MNEFFKPASLEEAQARYGEIINNTWPDEAKHMTLLQLSPAISNTLINSASGKFTQHIYCNKDLVEPLTRAFDNIFNRDLLHELKTFDGCYCVRDIRGKPGEPSAHSWGIAVDFNSKQNPLGGPVAFSQRFLQCFRDAELFCGADFERVDGMHFSLMRL